jgi:hypothetical protein
MDAEGSGSTLSWHKDEVVADWSEAIKTARKRLMVSSTRSRIDFLTDELLPLAKDPGVSLHPRCMMILIMDI